MTPVPYANPEQQRRYQREWIARRRADWFAGKVCATEGCEVADGLELDHVDPNTKVAHSVWSWSAERREAELAKCRPLCPEHHRSKSSTETPRGERHGMVRVADEVVARVKGQVILHGRSVPEVAREFGFDQRTVRGWAAGEWRSEVEPTP